MKLNMTKREFTQLASSIITAIAALAVAFGFLSPDYGVVMLSPEGAQSLGPPAQVDNQAEARGVSNFSSLAVASGGLIDCNGEADCFVVDADGDTTLASDTDDQMDFEVGGSDVAVLTSSSLTLTGLFLSSFANETITDGETLTPTVTTYALDSAGAVTVTLAAAGTEGQLLVLVGDDANNVTVADTNIRTSDGNAAVMGQYDITVWVYQDSEWILLADVNNS